MASTLCAIFTDAGAYTSEFPAYVIPCVYSHRGPNRERKRERENRCWVNTMERENEKRRIRARSVWKKEKRGKWNRNERSFGKWVRKRSIEMLQQLMAGILSANVHRFVCFNRTIARCYETKALLVVFVHHSCISGSPLDKLETRGSLGALFRRRCCYSSILENSAEIPPAFRLWITRVTTVQFNSTRSECFNGIARKKIMITTSFDARINGNYFCV